MVNLYNDEIGNSAVPTKCARNAIPGTTSSSAAAGNRRRYAIVAIAIGALTILGAAKLFFTTRHALT